MKHKILIPAVLTAVATLFLSLPPAAAAVTASVPLAPAVVPPTLRVLMRGSDFAAGDQVVFLFDRARIGAHPADANGALKAPSTTPPTACPDRKHVVWARSPWSS
jgi:hypothetical protein